MALGDIFFARIFVALLDQQPLLFFARRSLLSLARSHQSECAVELVTAHANIELSVLDRLRDIVDRIDCLIDPAIPYYDGARPIVALGNDAFEIAILQWMVLDHHRQA